MASPTETLIRDRDAATVEYVHGMPVLYEDDEEGDMGEASVHVAMIVVIYCGLKSILESDKRFQVFANLNLYYVPQRPAAYVSPDCMVVATWTGVPAELTSYRIGQEGPAPVLTVEVLSERSAQQRDLAEKLIVYAKLGVPEYILVDVTGAFLPERLLLKRLQSDETWVDEQDDNGGVTSKLGFRLIIEDDGRLRVIDKATGRR
jgi:Uma2 family endonuclease